VPISQRQVIPLHPTSHLNPTNSNPSEQCQSHFELGVALSLNLWPALSLAVSNNWGGAASQDKRDWFAGAVVELFEERPDTDLEDVETVLLQVMLDEFEVNVDDESGYDIAEQIIRLRRDVGRGNFVEVEQLKERWEKRGGQAIGFQRGEDEEGETDGSDDESEDEDEDEDVEMGDAPTPRERPAPEVDEDGFTKVQGKKKR
jgi:pre-rRNA-processing protein TSR2